MAAILSVVSPGFGFAASIANERLEPPRVSRAAARQIVSEFLLTEGRKRLRAGNTVLLGNFWLVTVTTRQGIAVKKIRVDRKTGKVSMSG